MIWMGFYEITLILNKNRVILSQVGLLAVKSIRKIAWVHQIPFAEYRGFIRKIA